MAIDNVASLAETPINQQESQPLLPRSIASLVSLATSTSSISLRIGSAIGNAAISGARIGTLAGFEVGRIVLEGILSRAGQDVVDGSAGPSGRAAAESTLENAIGTVSLNSSIALSEQILSAVDAILGDTETSKAIATILTLIQRESRMREIVGDGERIGVSDLLTGLIGFALLQRWCIKQIESAWLEDGVLEPIWDLVVLEEDLKQPESMLLNAEGSDEEEESCAGQSPNHTQFLNRHEDYVSHHDTQFASDSQSYMSLMSAQPSIAGQARRDTWFSEQISQQLSPGTFVQLTTQTEAIQTVKVDIAGDSVPAAIEPPKGYSLVAVENSNSSENDLTRFIFQSRRKRVRRQSLEVEKPDVPLAVTFREDSERFSDVTDINEEGDNLHLASEERRRNIQLIDDRGCLDEAPQHGTRAVANEKRARQQYHSTLPEVSIQPSTQPDASTCNERKNVPPPSVQNQAKLSLKKAIRENASVKNLVDFWSRDRLRRTNNSAEPSLSGPDAGRELLASSRRGSTQLTHKNPQVSQPLSRVNSFHDSESSSGRRGSVDHQNYGHVYKHNRANPSVCTIATDMSETSVVLHSTPTLSNQEIVVSLLRREGVLPGMYPRKSFARNMARYARFSMAAYGSVFIKLMGTLPKSDIAEGQSPEAHDEIAQHRSFSSYSRLPSNTVILSSFVDPEGGSNAAGETDTGMPLVHYVSLDHESKAIVLTCRGTLGFEDVLTDMSCDYDSILWNGRSFQVHKGVHASARRMLTLHRGRIISSIKIALEEHDGYGLVLCGHSLGGAVASLLAILLAEPNTKSAGGTSKFVTASRLSDSQGLENTLLPPNRPIHVYAYGPAAVFSPALQKATKGLITTVINNQDVVPYLSLGTLRDSQSIALAFKTDTNDAKGEVRRRIWGGILQAIREQTGLGQSKSMPMSQWGQDAAEGDEDQWPLAALKSLRASMTAAKLVPPGEVFIMQASPVLQRHAFVSGNEPNSSSSQIQSTDNNLRSYNPGVQIKVNHVRDVVARFSELKFGASMFLDHIPARYEHALSALERGLCS